MYITKKYIKIFKNQNFNKFIINGKNMNEHDWQNTLYTYLTVFLILFFSKRFVDYDFNNLLAYISYTSYAYIIYYTLRQSVRFDAV